MHPAKFLFKTLNFFHHQIIVPLKGFNIQVRMKSLNKHVRRTVTEHAHEDKNYELFKR